jgi:WD40 repeat protein
MEFSPETIFISYSRTDGRAFAEMFERRLEHEAEIKSWRDLKSIEGGEDIRPQVLRAIERVKHLVLILSRRSLVSDWVKREWTHARMAGRKVSPVLADPSIKRSDLPGWIRRAEVYDISEPERWKMLLRVLEGPGETRRVPYMSGDVPDDFVPRPAEYEKLKEAVLSAGSSATVAVTTALLGAGGYGKTTLANQLCRDPDIRFEFTDGILRVEIGKERHDLTGLVIDLIETLDPEGKRPGFQDIQTASEHLAELIGEARLLLVIDDVWREAQLRPFLKGGPNCVRLVTTRLPQVLPRSYVPIAVDEMRANEAFSLIAASLQGADLPAARVRLAALADRLGAWAQMLSIANGWLRGRTELKEPLLKAIAEFEGRLNKKGLTAFEPKDETQRNRAIRACVEASLEDLEEDELGRLGELAILPEDENVPLGVIEALWAERGGLDEDQTDDLVRRFNGLSLLQSLDLGARTLRLHDNMLWYLRDRIGPEGGRAAHTAMIQALGAACNGRWEKLPAAHTYGWRFLIRHLREAGLGYEADSLLADYAWIKAKLGAVGAQELFASYLPAPEDEGAQLVGRAIALSLPALTATPREFPRQLYGRLGAVEHERALSVAAAAREDEDFRPAPRWPGLTAPGAEELRLTGHGDSVTSAAFSPDGSRIVTASRDLTARVWDAITGAEITVLRGHEGWVLRGYEFGVLSAAFSPDGSRIATASGADIARIWNAISGAETTVLRGHEGRVLSAGFSPDGFRIVTASEDATARIWNASTGTVITVLRGHDGGLGSAAYSSDGSRIVTASHDRTARIWDAITGTEIIVLRGHESSVGSAVFSPDGFRILTASYDRTARIWDAITGAETTVLRGHEGSVESAAFSRDGFRIVTASDDHTARIWNPITGAEITVLRGHNSGLEGAAYSPDGSRVVTASHDHTARIWDTAVGREIIALHGHNKSVSGAAFSPDGSRMVTASDDHTARIWDAITGAEITILSGHKSTVGSAAYSFDGSRIVTASHDRTARIWDAITGAEITVLSGHEFGVSSAAYSPDGSRIVTASADHTVRIWNAITGAEITVLRGHEYGVYSAAFSSDGSRIVTASDDNTARIWNAKTGAEMVVLRGHVILVLSAVFSPDGFRIVTASNDHTARIWNAITGSEMVVLRGHAELVVDAAFSSDGSRIVTASYDGTVRIWDASTGGEIICIPLDAAVTALALRNGDIALGDRLGRIHAFEAEEFLGKKGTAS